MHEKVKTAITSFGMSGQVFHGPSLKVHKGFEVVQVLERTKTLSKKLFPDAKIVTTYDSILSNPEIELVIVNTPDHLHYEMAKQAIESGKHILVEKPVTFLSAQAAELVEFAKKKGVVFTVYQNRRWDGDFLTVKKVLEHGNLGRLIEFESHFDRYRTFIVPDTWKEEGGEYAGVLYGLGSHMVDQAFVLFGKPSAVTAHLKIVRNAGMATDYYDVRLEYEGFSALLKCSYLVKKPGPRYSIFGEYGTFHKWGIDPQEEILKTGVLPGGNDWGKEPEENWGELVYGKGGVDFVGKVATVPGNYSAVYDNLYDVIRNGTELAVKPEETVEVLKILEACMESNRLKKTVEL
jgi:scyllo-inositol 2-dehydrogenase (NADP+)